MLECAQHNTVDGVRILCVSLIFICIKRGSNKSLHVAPHTAKTIRHCAPPVCRHHSQFTCTTVSVPVPTVRVIYNTVSQHVHALVSTPVSPLQALGDAERQAYMKGKRILEVNPRHPLIQQVKDKFEAQPDNAANGALAKLLYETALLESGFQVCIAL